MTIDDAMREAQAGLPSHRAALTDAQANQDYYDGDSVKHVQIRDGEDELSFRSRRKRTSMVMAEVVDALCRHLYNPGPTRTCGASAEADAWLQAAWEKCEINSVWQEADRLCTLNDWCLIQVAGNDDPEAPVKLQVWGREEAVVWTSIDDPTVPAIVCTIDRHDGQTRYRVYDETEVVTLQTRKWDQSAPTGQRSRMDQGVRAATLVSRENHNYGELPFVAVHYRRPVRWFHTVGPGTPLRRLNAEIDAMLCDLAEGVQYFARPVMLGYNLPEFFRPVMRAGGIVRVETDRKLAEMGGEPPEARLEPFSVPIDIDALWADINNQIDHALENFGVPKAAVRMTGQTAASGAAIVQEQKPLMDRAKSRRPQFARHERDLAAKMLRIGGVWWGNPGLYEAGADPKLSLTWPEAYIDTPGPERDLADRAALELGVTSRVQILMQRDGLTEDQALEKLRKFAEHEDLFAELFPNSPTTVYSPQQQQEQQEMALDAQAQAEAQGKAEAPAAAAEGEAEGKGK